MRIVLPFLFLTGVFSRSVFRKSTSAISSDSGLGRKILSNARRLNDDVDVSFLKDYQIKYLQCSTRDWYSDGDGDEEERFLSQIDTQTLAVFRLCPDKDSCASDCAGGAEYVIDMISFVDAFTEAQMTAREYTCEFLREYCENADDEEACYEGYEDEYPEAKQCYNAQNEEDFNIQEYLECKEYDGDENGYYVGPYCKSGLIYLGLFTDDSCTTLAESGNSIPYADEPIINADECARCKEHALEEHKDDEDQEDDDEVFEICEGLYEESSKCEEDIEIDNLNQDGCSFIAELKEENTMNNSGNNGFTSSSKTIWFGILIALLAGAVILLAFWLLVLRRRSQNKPKLADQSI